MKKITIIQDKQLQRLLATDEEFRQLPVFRYALAVINFVAELSATGIVPPPLFPILSGDREVPETIRLTESELKLFVEAHKMSGRMEAYIQPGPIEVCLAVEIIFYSKGRGNVPLLVVHAGSDSMAVRRFAIDRPVLDELQSLYDRGREERRKRDVKEATIRALAHIGP